MLRIALRFQRVGVVGMSAFGALYGVLQTAAFFSAAGSTAAERAAFGHQMETIGRSLSYLLPLPVRVDTLAGYVQWRVYGALPLVLGFWAVMSASGAARGDEEQGIVELWMSAGIARARYVGARMLGFLVVAAIAILATSAGILLGGARESGGLGIGPVTGMAAALLAVTMVCYAITLVTSQLAPTRSAAAATSGILLLALYLLDGFSRTLDALKPFASAVSPFYYYDRSRPLVPGGSFEVAGATGLFLGALATAGLAAWLMDRRDIGTTLFRRPIRRRPAVDRPSHNPLLRHSLTATIYEQRLSFAAWLAGTALITVAMAAVGREIVNLAKGGGGFRDYLTIAGHGDPYVALTGYFWLGVFQMLLCVYAITQVARWSADDSEGRLEMVLSAPVSRVRVVADRAAALLAGTAALVVGCALVFYLVTHAQGIHVPAGYLTRAALVLIPFTTSLAAAGMIVASRAPRLTVSILAALTLESYLITELGPLFKWPDWVLKLSIFSLYGTPLTDGVYWTGLWILLGVSLGGFVAGAALLQRRDVGS